MYDKHKLYKRSTSSVISDKKTCSILNFKISYWARHKYSLKTGLHVSLGNVVKTNRIKLYSCIHCFPVYIDIFMNLMFLSCRHPYRSKQKSIPPGRLLSSVTTPWTHWHMEILSDVLCGWNIRRLKRSSLKARLPSLYR